MKSIKDSIVFLNYPGVVSDRNTKLLYQELLKLRETLTERNILGIYICIKDKSFDEASLEAFIKELEKISKTLLTEIALGDYTRIFYEKLRTLTLNTHIKLFKTTNIARLFFNPKIFTKKLKVLLYDDGDEQEVDKQASLLAKFEHSIVYAHSVKEFQEKLDNHEVDLAISQTKINQVLDKSKAQVQVGLSKNLVTNLPFFIDTAVDNLEMLTGLKANKIAHAITPFNTDLKEVVSSVMKFKGDVEGNFVLIFPKNLALQAIEAMVGEKLEESDHAGISDGVGEFCNIITGSTKTLFSKKDIKVLFELPKTFTNMTTTKNMIGDSSGIWIDMQLEEKPFYMFISK